MLFDDLVVKTVGVICLNILGFASEDTTKKVD